MRAALDPAPEDLEDLRRELELAGDHGDAVGDGRHRGVVDEGLAALAEALTDLEDELARRPALLRRLAQEGLHVARVHHRRTRDEVRGVVALLGEQRAR